MVEILQILKVYLKKYNHQKSIKNFVVPFNIQKCHSSHYLEMKLDWQPYLSQINLRTFSSY